MKIAIKVILIGLLVGCLFNMPYGYYQFVRFVGLVGFILLAYWSYEQKRNEEVILCITLALLFQPFIKVAFGRTVWNVVDVIVAVGLILSLLRRKRDSKRRYFIQMSFNAWVCVERTRRLIFAPSPRLTHKAWVRLGWEADTNRCKLPHFSGHSKLEFLIF